MAARRGNKASLLPGSSSLTEWIAAALGAMIVVLMAGLLTWYGFQEGDSAPDVAVVRNGPVRPVSSGYRVEFVARNVGSATAAQLRIEGELRIGGIVEERSVAIMDYLPGHSERKGGLFFRRDPRTAQLRIYTTGYEKP